MASGHEVCTQRLPWLVGFVVVVGCGGSKDHSPIRDANVDHDAPPMVCATGRLLTGELVDLDSSATIIPIAGAKLTAPTGTATSGADGAFGICVPEAAPIVLQLDAPGDYLDGSIYLEAVAHVRFRAVTRTRAETFYAERELVFDPESAHVLVHHMVDVADVAIDHAHDDAQAGNAAEQSGVVTWEKSTGGRYVLFPNVEVGDAMLGLSEPQALPGGIRDHTLSIDAGTLVLVAVSIVFGP